MKHKYLVLGLITTALLGCGEVQLAADVAPVELDKNTEIADGTMMLKGQWITEPNGDVMIDPQTSGLTVWNDKLVSLSDRSADVSQRMQLHVISPDTAKLSGKQMMLSLSESLKDSCFAGYIQGNPDLEALVAVPDEPGVFLTITEDASSYKGLSESCVTQYGESGSVDYPFVLIRLEVQQDDSVLMTHARPLKFSPSFNLEDYPNDGIEGLALSQDGRLYFALERDAQDRARIFTTTLNQDTWLHDGFIVVEDSKVKLPAFKHGNHPINALELYERDGHEYLFAAARNDEKLWLVDLAGQQETLIINLGFYAAVNEPDDICPAWEPMDNASIEGLTIIDDTLWMVNDPWKKVYLNNISCEQNRAKFEKMAPLLFNLPIQDAWFTLGGDER
ncbi:MAG: hypothetical protein CL578_19505 [Alteromonadaceae bacterium]|uniref:esterase-like activity of phytase family protein n=1 Tax=Paraglaciecola chathamensis TaxID=368405 RepID=UPI000C46D8C2|nr:esterase-like activity of phytase family protein [Paraglaciecola agarilytica]MBN27211.1 hypothetical protein [Alteromonadaceae bacterium]|tara:strand:+ start:28884 stop:30056 length:1173 start_codon:yes stop_codon:yes gene_type:complete